MCYTPDTNSSPDSHTDTSNWQVCDPQLCWSNLQQASVSCPQSPSEIVHLNKNMCGYLRAARGSDHCTEMLWIIKITFLSRICRVAFLLELALLALQVKHQEVAAKCLKELKSAGEAVSNHNSLKASCWSLPLCCYWTYELMQEHWIWCPLIEVLYKRWD